MAVEFVNDKYLMIEFEENDTYNTLEKLKNALNSLDLDIDNSNYFVKKAKIVFEDTYKGEQII